MSLEEEFRELGFEMSQILKKELDRMKDNAQNTINIILEETQKKIQKDLLKLEQGMIQNAEIELNKQITDKTNEINRKIIEEKNNFIEHFIELVKQEIKKRINSNSQGYLKYIIAQIEDSLSLIPENATIYVNQNDQSLLSKPENKAKIEKFHYKLCSKPTNTLGGIKVIANDNSLVLDSTLESKINLMKDEISKRFMSIFPIFEINIPNAFQIYDMLNKQDHGANNEHDN
jgi:vacuolar-type H+-ATPase subunit E/Vma4